MRQHLPRTCSWSTLASRQQPSAFCRKEMPLPVAVTSALASLPMAERSRTCSTARASCARSSRRRSEGLASMTRFFIVAICALKLALLDTACAARRSSPAAVFMRSCAARTRARSKGSFVSHCLRIFLERSMEPSTPPEAHVCGCNSVVPQNLDKTHGLSMSERGSRRQEDGPRGAPARLAGLDVLLGLLAGARARGQLGAGAAVLLLGVREKRDRSRVRAVGTLERAHTRLQLAVLRPVDAGVGER